MAIPTSGYINGSDILLSIGTKAIGHCTSHDMTWNTETKDRAVKPAAAASYSAGLWKGKSVTGLSISISAEGLQYYGEAENGIEELRALWGAATPVTVKAYKREGDATPYLEGSFVITNVQETNPAQDDGTYSISLENNGEPTTYPGKPSA